MGKTPAKKNKETKERAFVREFYRAVTNRVLPADIREVFRHIQHDDSCSPHELRERLASLATRATSDYSVCGSDALVNALNILGVEHGVRDVAMLVGYTYAPQGGVDPQNDPVRVRRIRGVVSKHLANVRLLDEDPEVACTEEAESRILARDGPLTQEAIGELLGYVSPGEQNGELRIGVYVSVPGEGETSRVYLFSYEAALSLDATQLRRLLDQRDRMQGVLDVALPGTSCEVEVARVPARSRRRVR